MKLVIAEKPSVARILSDVLGATRRAAGYLEGNGYWVSWCIGHLIELAQPEQYGDQWKKWNYESLPIEPEQWQYVVKEETKSQYEILKQLMQNQQVEEVICATDAGREGELIFRLVYQMAKCQKPVKRLWISSMEETAIKAGFQNLRSGGEYDRLYDSAVCRQEADWLVGINGTRLFTVLYGGKILKVGRVQSPTLAMLVNRETEIMNFKKESYYVVHIHANGVDAVSEHIHDQAEAEKLALSCEQNQAQVRSLKKEEKSIAPPKLYDLTALQRDANRIFGFTAKQTLEYTQSLYEKKLVTYPRTDSQYLSDDMGDTAQRVIEAICESNVFELNEFPSMDISKVLNSKKVTDHHAIIPTVEISKQNIQEIPEGERMILLLCANRLLCAVGEKCIYDSVQVQITCGEAEFKAFGREVHQNGWKDLKKLMKKACKMTEEESESEDDRKLPELVEGMVISIEDAKASEQMTQPPKHYTEDSLLLAMERAGSEEMDDSVERKGLGTPATRADIIEKLVKDGFVKREKKQMIPTEDGMKLITVLPEMVKSPKLTADWENKLALVAKGEFSKEQFMLEIKEMVEQLVGSYHEISEKDRKFFRPESSLGDCPKCQKPVVKGKYGFYCTGKCGMNVGRAMGKELSEKQVRLLLRGKKIFMKEMKSKQGKSYDAWLIPVGISEYTYDNKNGVKSSGYQYQFQMEFEKQKKEKK